jgi:hypothetical protein
MQKSPSIELKTKNHKEIGSQLNSSSSVLRIVKPYPFNFSVYYPLTNSKPIDVRSLLNVSPYNFGYEDYIFGDMSIERMLVSSNYRKVYNCVSQEHSLINTTAYFLTMINTFSVYDQEIRALPIFSKFPIINISLCLLQNLFSLENTLDANRRTGLDEISLLEGRKIVLFSRPKVFNLLYTWSETPQSLYTKIEFAEANYFRLQVSNTSTFNTDKLNIEMINNTVEYIPLIKNLSFKRDRIMLDYGIYFLRRSFPLGYLNDSDIDILLPAKYKTEIISRFMQSPQKPQANKGTTQKKP